MSGQNLTIFGRTWKQAGAELGQAQPQMAFEVRIGGWVLKLEIEVADSNCSLKFKFDIDVWIWRWNSNLNFKIEVLIWRFDLKFWFEV